MRKIIISLVAMLLACTAHSQVKTTERLDLGWPDRSSLSIPKEFTFNNVPLLTMHDDSDENLLVYDENIELIKTINTRQEKTFNYQLTFQDEEREVVSVDVAGVYEQDLYTTYETWLNQIMASDPTFTDSSIHITKEENGDSLIVVDFTDNSFYSVSDYYFNYDYFGKQYPKRYWRCKNGRMYMYNVGYNVTYSDWHVTGTRTEDRQETLRRIRLCNINLNYGDGRANYYFDASQTLFNKDEEFEYIIPKYTLSATEGTGEYSVVDDGIYGEERIETKRTTNISEKSKLALIGFQIVSADGAILNDLTFGSEVSAKPDRVYIVTIGEKTYIAIDASINDNNCTLFYLIDRETTDIKKVNVAPARLCVSPTIADRNATININFGDENATGAEIKVISAAGTQVKQSNVPAGQRETQITLNGASGVYNVVQIQNNTVKATQKIILK